MAEFQNTNNVTTNVFNKGMLKDLDVAFNPEGVWTHARNAVNNTIFGQTGVIGNEPANELCQKVPYTIIGLIPNEQNEWVVFSTDNITSEIGLFNESDCSYKKIVKDACLNFKKEYLITGVARENFDCTRSVYFSDGLNPDRVLNLTNPQFITKKRKIGADCYVDEKTDKLDCEALRLAPLFKTPCLSLEKSVTGGNLINGSYQAAIAYTVNNIRVTDYVGLSNVQSLFEHAGVGGGLDVNIDSIDDQAFDEFELVLIATVFQATAARSIGFYSTKTKKISISNFPESLPVVPLSDIQLITPAYEKSDAIFEVNGYLMRTGIYTKFDINYQPQANKIVSKWVETKVPATYYNKGGNAVSYMRDEVYSFFIRWIYNTGEKTAAYHIPGRASIGSDRRVIAGADALESLAGGVTRKWQAYDTSDITSTTSYDLPEVGGVVTKEGTMSYWESTERYPDNSPDIWGDLCGKPIRHHKFPDNCTTHINTSDGLNINLLGVKFENISHPLDNNGNPIASIVGYEILRGSREGNKTIIAKGLLNNMGEYVIDPENDQARKGLYQNYPFNDLNVDPFLSLTEVKGGCEGKGYKPMGTFKDNIFSFHSPETQFRDPYLSPFELKVHGEVSGRVNASFSPVYQHPEHKMLRDIVLFNAAIIGTGIGLLAMKGRSSTTVASSAPQGIQTNLTIAGVAAGTITNTPGGTPEVFPITGTLNPLANAIKAGAFTGTTKETSPLKENWAQTLVGIATGTYMFTYFFGQGMEQTIRIMNSLITFQQYAYQYNGHGFYTNYTCPIQSNTRRRVQDAQYINPYLQDFGLDYRINNLFRNRIVAVTLDNDLDRPKVTDDSRVTIGNLGIWKTPKVPFDRTTSAYYASLKVSMPAQYGQLASIIQIPVSTCVNTTQPDKDAKYTSPVLFGGDVYINRYTEKNSFFFFNDWLFNQPDGARFDYLKYVNIPYPRYWIDTNDYNVSKLIQPFAAAGGAALTTNVLLQELFPKKADGTGGISNFLSTLISAVTGAGSLAAIAAGSWKDKVLPNDYRHLDRMRSDCRSRVAFGIEDAYFYLFANGVRDFFVESEVNLAQRDWGEQLSQQIYDPYRNTDLTSLFRSDIIKSGNYYKYDYSLSVSRLITNNTTWGSILPSSFDPKVAETCYSYYDNRIIYSLPQDDELKKDNWRVYLANNYEDFGGKVTSIKQVNQSGCMILMKDHSPQVFPGVDQLQTQNGIKVTIGDAGLFAGNIQNLSNAEAVYEQASCQSRYSVINTAAGLFWVSQNQGKVFQFTNGMAEISRNGMKWWFAKYLPSALLEDFPQFELYDNPVAGVGAMLTFDNTNEILYLSKKDYKLKDEYKGRIVYNKGSQFLLGRRKIPLGDPTYFEDASFTVSYDVKNQMWVSFHDWHPNLVIPSREHFMTVVNNGIWRHNDRCDKFCNFYGKDYPFEVEYVASTGQEVTILKSIEYQLECYKYANYCRDVNHVLDYNFDQAVVYNTEQVSGILKLIERQKNDPLALLEYPVVQQSQITIMCSKEENKYRFNQFWDITRNRGEFTPNYQTIWETSANGYEKTLNPLYVNYDKGPLQRKKFRHYMTRVLLKRLVSDDIKMLFRISNNKLTKSFR